MKPKTRWIVFAAVAGCGIAGCVFGVFWLRSFFDGTRAFRAHVMDPMPKSVRILCSESVDVDLDYRVYLRFRCTPKDMAAVITARKYSISSSGTEPSDERTPDWWKHRSGHYSCYYLEQQHPNSEAFAFIAWLLVNDDQTEAYFAYWDF